MARIDVMAAGGKNILAFLDMIAWSEIGETMLKKTDDGYNVIVGSVPDMILTFSSYARHPGALMDMDGKPGGLQSTAAGRYQCLARYWPNYKFLLKLPDFGPVSQDKIALQLIRECHAVSLLQQGQFSQAVIACKSRWASLPGAGYDQHEHKIEDLQLAYTSAGGEISK